jgi:hypothetical protein
VAGDVFSVVRPEIGAEGEREVREWLVRGEMTMLMFYCDALRMVDPSIPPQRRLAAEERIGEAEEKCLRMVSQRSGTFHPDAPIYWPPMFEGDYPPTYRLVYERLALKGKKAYGNLAWVCKGIPVTPTHLRKNLEAAGFNMNPREVNLPYIGGWPGCKEWKERIRHIWDTRAHVCTRCGRAIPRGRGGGQVHNLDGNSRNNRDENLALRCRDCHALSSGFRRRKRTKKSANDTSR